jgi:hypothetical protein
MDIISVAIGAVGVFFAWFSYLAATRGLPAALAWAKAKWNAGKTELAAIRGDIGDAQTKIAALEQGAIAGLDKRLAVLEAQMAGLKPAPAVAAAAPAAAPTPVPQPAAPAPGAV